MTGDVELLSRAAEFEAVALEAEDQARRLLSRRELNELLARGWGGTHVLEELSPWAGLVSEPSGPNMLSAEERQYLRWVSQFVATGAVVELGPWLGESSRCVLSGLPATVTLHTFDDFVWRAEWMAPYMDVAGDWTVPANGATFRPLFEAVNADWLDRLVIGECHIEELADNSHLPALSWDRENHIELVIVDCGRTISVNDAWFDALRSYFISGRTLIVMQDWRLSRQRPKEFFNQTDLFTAKHRDVLHQIHEVSDGGIASFVYCEVDAEGRPALADGVSDQQKSLASSDAERDQATKRVIEAMPQLHYWSGEWSHGGFNRETLEGPGVLVVGFQKCRTTWLWKNLSAHPGYRVSEVKELDFFTYGHDAGARPHLDASLYRRIAEGLAYWTRPDIGDWEREHQAEYIRRYRQLVEQPFSTAWYSSVFSDSHGGTRVGVDVSPSYATLPPESVLSFFGDALPQVQFIVRDPLDRLWSAIRHELRLRGQSDSDYKQILAVIADAWNPYVVVDYEAVITPWAELLGDRLRVSLFEHASEDPIAWLDGFAEWSNVAVPDGWIDHSWAHASERVHAASSVGMPDWLREVGAELVGNSTAWVRSNFPSFLELG